MKILIVRFFLTILIVMAGTFQAQYVKALDLLIDRQTNQKFFVQGGDQDSSRVAIGWMVLPGYKSPINYWKIKNIDQGYIDSMRGVLQDHSVNVLCDKKSASIITILDQLTKAFEPCIFAGNFETNHCYLGMLYKPQSGIVVVTQQSKWESTYFGVFQIAEVKGVLKELAESENAESQIEKDYLFVMESKFKKDPKYLRDRKKLALTFQISKILPVAEKDTDLGSIRVKAMTEVPKAEDGFLDEETLNYQIIKSKNNSLSIIRK